MTDYMKAVSNDLIEKKGIRETTVKNYIRSLKIANCNKNFTSLEFLKKKAQVDECIEKYKDGSKKAIFTGICSVLKMYRKDDLHKYYYEKLLSHDKPVTHDKTDTQKENWIEWADVLKIKQEYRNRPDTKENRLRNMVLSLYTEIQPRRVLDYIVMYVVPKIKTDLASDKNYIALKENVFVFNRYKTDKKYGKQVIHIPAELRKSINEYLSKHPLNDEKMYPFLINAKNQPFKGSNSITMLLNRIFKKKISASMLRHIYLTNEFGDDLKKRQETAKVMGHSVAEQADYIKFD